MDVQTNTQVDNTYSNMNIMCLWFSAQLGLFIWGTSLSELREGWKERPHHSWQISAYLHYVCRDERREMDEFYYLRVKFLLSAERWCFSVLISGARDKRRGAFHRDKVLIWMEEWMCVRVHAHTAFLCVFRWKEWTGMNSCCIWVRVIIKQCESSGLNTYTNPK